MAHTRELAFQISKEYERFSKYTNNVKIAVFFGGMPVKKDEEVLQKNCPHIVVGTPGRLFALAKAKTLSLKHIKHFILDECDKMLADLGKWKLFLSRSSTSLSHSLPLCFACVWIVQNYLLRTMSFLFCLTAYCNYLGLLQICVVMCKRSSVWHPTRSKWWCSAPPSARIFAPSARSSCKM